MNVIRVLLIAAGLWALAGCGGENIKALLGGKIFFVSPFGQDSNHKPESITSDKATIVALPIITDQRYSII